MASVSSGSIVGAASVPTAKLILTNSTGTSSFKLTACLNREYVAGQSPDELIYQFLYPTKVGCDIALANALITDESSLYGLNASTNQWEMISDAIVTFTPDSGTLGTCFNVGVLSVSNIEGTYCDLFACIDGTFVLPPCKSIQGCENFCVYISEIPSVGSA